MSDERTNGLHLPDLSIRNFRGIGFLAIRRLGRVTLLGGRNGVGKTTVLEAVRVSCGTRRYARTARRARQARGIRNRAQR